MKPPGGRFQRQSIEGIDQEESTKGGLEISLPKHQGDRYMQKRGIARGFPWAREEKPAAVAESPHADPGPRGLLSRSHEEIRKTRHRLKPKHSSAALADFNPLEETGNVVEAICKLILMSRLQTAPPGGDSNALLPRRLLRSRQIPTREGFATLSVREGSSSRLENFSSSSVSPRHRYASLFFDNKSRFGGHSRYAPLRHG